MLQKTICSIFVLISLFSVSLQGEIVQISNIQEIKSDLEAAEQDTWVLFDVDRTLLVMPDQLFITGKTGFLKGLKQFLEKNPSYQLSDEKRDYLVSLALLKTSTCVVEDDVLDLISDLQSRQIKTMVLTSLVTGPLGIIPSMEEYRMETLKSAGFSFDKAFPEIKEISFDDNKLGKPVFKEGVLCTGKQGKGKVFKQFLDKINLHPKRVIMVDDQLDALQSVENELLAMGIDFKGFHYLYVEEKLIRPLSDEIAAIQFSYLLTHEIWLSDEEARTKGLDPVPAN